MWNLKLPSKSLLNLEFHSRIITWHTKSNMDKFGIRYAQFNYSTIRLHVICLFKYRISNMSKLFYSFFINNLPNLSIKKYLKNKRPWANILFVLLSCRPNCYKTTKVKITKDHTNNIFKTIKSIGTVIFLFVMW